METHQRQLETRAARLRLLGCKFYPHMPVCFQCGKITTVPCRHAGAGQGGPMDDLFHLSPPVAGRLISSSRRSSSPKPGWVKQMWQAAKKRPGLRTNNLGSWKTGLITQTGWPSMRCALPSPSRFPMSSKYMPSTSSWRTSSGSGQNSSAWKHVALRRVHVPSAVIHACNDVVLTAKVLPGKSSFLR